MSGGETARTGDNNDRRQRTRTLQVLSNPRAKLGPYPVDLALLRAVSWQDAEMFTDPGCASLGLHRLKRVGLVHLVNGVPQLTPAGGDLLDDDF